MKYLPLLFILVGTAQADILATPPPVVFSPSMPLSDPSSRLHRDMTNLYLNTRNSILSAYRYIWNNTAYPNGTAYGLLGTDCKRFHQLFTRAAAVVNYGVPGTIVAEPKTVTENADGTCTVGP